MSSKALTKTLPETPYKLDPAQTLKASDALLKHIKKDGEKREEEASKKNLLADQDTDAAEPIQLIVTTKKQIVHEKSLKPRKIPVPHTLNVDSAVESICLITPDPQRAFKDVVADPAFPKELGNKIRVIGIDKVKKRFKSFEEKRRFRDLHQVFLADDRIVTMLPGALGKVFFESGAKRPLPVSLSVRSKDAQGKTGKGEKKILSDKRIKADDKEVSILKPEAFAREIEKTLSCAQIHLTPSVTTSVRVGFSTFTAKQLAENVEAVVNGMVEKFVPKGWKSVRTILIKGTKTTSLTIWQTPQLWEEEEDVIENADAAKLKELEAPAQKRKALEADKEEQQQPAGRTGKKQKLLNQTSAKDAKEAVQRREKMRQQKQGAKKAILAA